MEEPNDSSSQRGDSGTYISTHIVEVITALILLCLAALVIYDAVRVGNGWESDGPQAGFYPFYVGLLLGFASLAILVQQFMHRGEDDPVFLAPGQTYHVMAVLLPSCAYVGAIYLLGIYVSSALFLFLFMRWQGKFGLMKTLPISIAVPLIVFLLFDKWFKIALPKGPLEAWLGL